MAKPCIPSLLAHRYVEERKCTEWGVPTAHPGALGSQRKQSPGLSGARCTAVICGEDSADPLPGPSSDRHAPGGLGCGSKCLGWGTAWSPGSGCGTHAATAMPTGHAAGSVVFHAEAADCFSGESGSCMLVNEALPGVTCGGTMPGKNIARPVLAEVSSSSPSSTGPVALGSANPLGEVGMGVQASLPGSMRAVPGGCRMVPGAAVLPMGAPICLPYSTMAKAAPVSGPVH